MAETIQPSSAGHRTGLPWHTPPVPIIPLPEPGHTGYLYCEASRCLAIDPPLDTAMVTDRAPFPITVVVQTGIPEWRANGARLLAGEVGAQLLAAATVGPPAQPLHEGDGVEGFADVVAVAAPTGIMLETGEGIFIGDLDAPIADSGTEPVVAARAAVAASHRGDIAYGSSGQRPAGALRQLDPPARGDRLNAHALELTNRGVADLWWADPRWVEPAPRIERGDLDARRGSPWAPIVVDLDGSAGTADARRIRPERLAVELVGMGSQEIVVVATGAELAERAAGFLVRLGMRASWAS